MASIIPTPPSPCLQEAKQRIVLESLVVTGPRSNGFGRYQLSIAHLFLLICTNYYSIICMHNPSLGVNV